MPQHTRLFFLSFFFFFLTLGRGKRVWCQLALYSASEATHHCELWETAVLFWNWHPGQACSWKWICSPLSRAFYFQLLPTPPFQLPLSRHHCACLAQQQRRVEEEANIFCPWDVLSRLCVHGFNAAFLEPTQTRPNTIVPVTDGRHFFQSNWPATAPVREGRAGS